MFNAPLVTAAENQDDIEGTWQTTTPETTPGFSAVAFFFARKLHLELGIPVIRDEELMEWVASWVAHGGESFGKPTHFESRDGRF
jgi:hypothetical protein